MYFFQTGKDWLAEPCESALPLKLFTSVTLVKEKEELSVLGSLAYVMTELHSC